MWDCVLLLLCSFSGPARHGEGLLVVAGSLRYKGAWVQDVQQGYGECQYADGTSYSGQWHGGQWHGEGRLQQASGAWYCGLWQEGTRQGKGGRDCTGAAELAGRVASA